MLESKLYVSSPPFSFAAAYRNSGDLSDTDEIFLKGLLLSNPSTPHKELMVCRLNHKHIVFTLFSLSLFLGAWPESKSNHLPMPACSIRKWWRFSLIIESTHTCTRKIIVVYSSDDIACWLCTHVHTYVCVWRRKYCLLHHFLGFSMLD